MKKLILVLTFITSPLLVRAQWVKITQPPLTGPNWAPYFINADTGFAYSASVGFGYGIVGIGISLPTDIEIARTTNGGQTWTALTFFNGTAIAQIYFESANHGFIAAAGKNRGIYESTDAGITWRKLKTPVADFSGVYAAGNTIAASKALLPTGSAGSGPDTSLIVSTDAGATWAIRPGEFHFIYGNRDSILASVQYFSNGQSCLTYSSDLGRTWLQSSVFPWQFVGMLYVIPHTCKIIVQYLDTSDVEGDTYSFSESDLPSKYSQWQPSLIHKETGAVIAGDGCVMYVSNAAEDQPKRSTKFALYRSSNLGISWVHDSIVPQPDFDEIDDNDFRNLSVVGNGSIIYASDFSGIWKSTDGGDGRLPGNPITITFNREPFGGGGITLFIAPCDSAVITTFDNNSLCAYAKLDSIWLTGLDPSEYRQHTLTHSSPCVVLPDTTVFVITPKQRGSTIVTISARFVDEDHAVTTKSMGVFIDVPNQLPPQLSISSAIDFGTVSTCDTRDTTIVIYNPNCDAITLTDAHLSTGEAFSLGSISLPLRLDSYDSIALHVHFASTLQSSFSDALVTTVKLNNTTFTTTNALLATVAAHTTIVVPQSPLSAGTFSFCTGDTIFPVMISSNGCDTVVISNISLQGNRSYTLNALSNDSLIVPGGNRSVQVQFTPREKGNLQTVLDVKWHLLHSANISDTTITGNGIGLPGIPLIAATPPSLDLGQIYECQSRDTTIVLTNPGCDTLHVTGGIFSNPSLTSSTIYPDTIPPGGSLTITVHADTVGSQGASTITGSYSSQSDAQNTLPDIPINLQVIPPVHLVLQIEPPQSGANRQQVTYLIRVIGPHPAKLFSAFYFDLTHNDDLLSFDTAIGDGFSVTNDPQVNGVVTQHCILAPVPLTDTIGKLLFTAYLSPVDSTNLEPMKFSFRNTLSLSPDCIARLDDSGSTFTYIPSCGDDLLQSVLRNQQIHIDRIVPNPAKDIIRIEGSDLTSLDVYDVMGRQFFPSQTASNGGVQIDIRDLAEGMYYLRAGNSTSRFVVER